MADRPDAVLAPCQQLLHRFFHCLDQFDYDGLLACFEPEATWHRQGTALHGHAAILAAMAVRPTTQRIRHVLSNTFVRERAGDTAQVVSYMTVYRFDNGEPQAGLVTIEGPFQLYTVHASVQAAVRPDGYRPMLRSLAITPEFRFARAA